MKTKGSDVAVIEHACYSRLNLSEAAVRCLYVNENCHSKRTNIKSAPLQGHAQTLMPSQHKETVEAYPHILSRLETRL